MACSLRVVQRASNCSYPHRQVLQVRIQSPRKTLPPYLPYRQPRIQRSRAKPRRRKPKARSNGGPTVEGSITVIYFFFDVATTNYSNRGALTLGAEGFQEGHGVLWPRSLGVLPTSGLFAIALRSRRSQGERNKGW